MPEEKLDKVHNLVLNDTRGLYAAAWLATKRTPYGKVWFRRVGDRLQIGGTNNYVAFITYLKDAKDGGSVVMGDWPDGSSVAIGGVGNIEGLMSLTDKGAYWVGCPLLVTIEDWGERTVIESSRRDRKNGNVIRMVRVDANEKMPNIEAFDSIEDSGDGGRLACTPGSLREIGKIAGIMWESSGRPWNLTTHGPSVAFTLDKAGGESRIVAMPARASV